jgi:hypothetical protein
MYGGGVGEGLDGLLHGWAIGHHCVPTQIAQQATPFLRSWRQNDER